jgi:DNA-binding Xre family transcriptional regulator
MTQDTLHRLRAGLAAKRFTLTALSEATGITVQRLSEMASPDWGRGVFKTLERLESIEAALDQIEGAS